MLLASSLPWMLEKTPFRMITSPTILTTRALAVPQAIARALLSGSLPPFNVHSHG